MRIQSEIGVKSSNTLAYLSMMIVIDLFYFSRWYNLTITNPSYDNLGEYLCVAENNGGVMESKVTLTFDDPSNFIDRTGGKNCFLLNLSKTLNSNPQ